MAFESFSLVEDIRRSIWHAFTALAKGEERQVAKSSLKALINNIGQAGGSEKAEEMIGDGTTDKLSFDDYFSIILNQVLLPATSGESPSSPVLGPDMCAKMDQICWLFCEAYYRKDSRLDQGGGVSSSLNTDDLFKLWKMFNFLVKVDLDGPEDRLSKAVLPLRVDVEEAHRVGSLIQQAVGYSPKECEVVDPTEDMTSGKDKGEAFGVDFVQFINTLCTMTNGLSSDVLREGLESVRQQILGDVMKKGFLEKFGNQLTTWKRRWFRLSAKQLQYFTSDLEQEMKGCIDINRTLRLENLSQRTGHKPFRFKLHTANKSFELAALDLRSKNEWLVALQKVSDHAGESSIQKNDLLTRERLRRQRRDRAEEQLFDRLLMRQKLQSRDQQLEHELQERIKDKSLLEKREQELEAERLARLDTEARLAKEEEAFEAKRKELEEIRAMLERLLEEERQAKRDEEIVRNLQSRILLEETEKREQLEQLKLEQERLLQHEREEREGLEQQQRLQDERQRLQEEMLSQAQQQLNLLAQERLHAEQQSLVAEEKMRFAEAERRKMEERLRLREMSTSLAMLRPKPLPDPDPYTTHRGRGAFVEADFAKKDEENSASPPGTEEED